MTDLGDSFVHSLDGRSTKHVCPKRKDDCNLVRRYMILEMGSLLEE